MSNLDGSVRRTLVWENVEKPRAIAVHPGAAAVIWTDWGHQPRIERSDMDGSNRQVLVTQDVVWPNGLVIDYTVNHVYWYCTLGFLTETRLHNLNLCGCCL